jgi:hypothetical protein
MISQAGARKDWKNGNQVAVLKHACISARMPSTCALDMASWNFSSHL